MPDEMPSREPLTCLVVEDEVAHALLMRDCLVRLGIEVVSAATQAEALRHLERRSFDLLLLDVRLPDGSGFEIQERIASKPDKPPILFVTSDDLAEDAVRAMRHGAANYVVKRPDYPEELRRAILTLLRAQGTSPKSEFFERERGELLEVLNAHRWNVSATARALGISRGKLRGRMKTLGLD